MEACVSYDVFDHGNSLHKKLVPYLVANSEKLHNGEERFDCK